MRLRKIKNADKKILDYSDFVILDYKDYKGKLNTVFKNDNPIYLEIGMGKGKFLIEHALKNPNINYIGLEKSLSILLKAARNIEEHNLNNLKILNVDAEELAELFSEASIDTIFLNFSDPWPKTKHHKRRLTAESFLNIYKYLLKEDGVIEFKTDNKKLFEYSIITMSEAGFVCLDINLNLHEEENPEIITTEYEEKFKSFKNTIYYLKVKK